MARARIGPIPDQGFRSLSRSPAAEDLCLMRIQALDYRDLVAYSHCQRLE